VMVDPEFRGMRIGHRLYEERQHLAERLNLRRILIAGRMPGYRDLMHEMSAKEYVRKARRNELKDPVLGFQLSLGFTPLKILDDYLPGDKESQGYAVLMEWNNVDYQRVGRRGSKTSHPVRICVIQYQLREIRGWKDFARQTEYFVDVAANYRSDFAVFPELLTSQLLSCIEEKAPVDAIRKLTTYTDQYIEHFCELAVAYNVNIIAGTHIVEEGDRLRNAAFLFRRDGTYAKQEKLHVTPNERRWWGIEGGSHLEVMDTDMGKIAINVCYDVEFPELARLAVDQGAGILFVPYCTEDRQGHLRVRYCAQARAVENQMYVVTSGTVGNLPDSENMDIQYAQSGIFSPSDFSFPRDGIAAEATANVETVVVGDIDLEVLRRSRRSGSVMQLQDRRRDLYEVRDLRAGKET
jgi:predicted amidohydrolase/GNAT superfamily N-acetyltransferase